MYTHLYVPRFPVAFAPFEHLVDMFPVYIAKRLCPFYIQFYCWKEDILAYVYFAFWVFNLNILQRNMFSESKIRNNKATLIILVNSY